MKTVCELNKCAGCMACIDICLKGAITIEDNLSAYNAVIDENKCIGCNACHSICQSNHPAKLMSPIMWHQGWSGTQDVRKQCSSGGIATALFKAFIEAGGVVCSCTFYNGKFVFEVAEKIEEVKKFAGSKYVKSNPEGIYTKVKEYLKKGCEVLFVGLPCQVSALKNCVGAQYEDNLFTVDLICHGTPSPELLEIFLKQYGYTMKMFQDIQFRVKAQFRSSGDYKGIITNGVSDKYSIAFLNSLIYTENCYSCQYARKERVSDLTLGDSWGSELPMDEQKKGVSLILCQTTKGKQLLEIADIHLEKVNIEKAIANNHQLSHPSEMPKGRNKFYKRLRNHKFNSLVFWQFPKQCLRQDVKQILIKARIIRENRGKLVYSILLLQQGKQNGYQA